MTGDSAEPRRRAKQNATEITGAAPRRRLLHSAALSSDVPQRRVWLVHALACSGSGVSPHGGAPSTCELPQRGDGHHSRDDLPMPVVSFMLSYLHADNAMT